MEHADKNDENARRHSDDSAGSNETVHIGIMTMPDAIFDDNAGNIKHQPVGILLLNLSSN